jgi:hypothetical protein
LVETLTLALAILTGAPEVSVTSNTEKEQIGSWVGVSETGIRLEQAGKAIEVSFADLLVLRNNSFSPFAWSLEGRVTCVDQSWVHAKSIDGEESGNVRIVPAGGSEPVSLPLKMIRAIRFGNGVGEIEQQWEKIVRGVTATDLLIVRRAGGALDQLSGVVKSVSKERVVFDLDGQMIDAPRSKLEGIVLRTVPVLPYRFEVEDNSGSIWNCVSLGGNGDRLVLETATGLRRQLTLDEIQRISSEGNAVYLTKLERASASYDPGFPVPLDPQKLAPWFGPSSSSNQVRLLATSKVEYRVPEAFQRFQATVAVDGPAKAGGGCELIVSGDEKELSRKKIQINHEEFTLALDLGKARRLVLELRAADQGTYGDIVVLKEARFLP